MKSITKTLNGSLALMAGTCLLMTGCARDISGTYKGSENVSDRNQQSINNEVSLSLNHNGDNVTAIFTGRNSNGNLTASLDGNNLSNVNLQTTVKNLAAVDPATTTVEQTSSILLECPGLYIGNLQYNENSDTITGSLELSSSGNNSCIGGARRTFNLKKEGSEN